MDKEVFKDLGYRMDSAGFLQRELNFVIQKTYETQYAPLMGRTLVPVDNSIPWGAETIEFEVSDRVGDVALISAATTEYPTAEAYITAVTRKGYRFGNFYQYTMQELDAIAYTRGRSKLDARRASAAMMAHETHFDRVALTGNTLLGWEGLFNQSSGVLTPAKAADWDAPATTAAAIIQDIATLLESIPEATKQAHRANTLVFPDSCKKILRAKLTTGQDNNVTTLIQTIFPEVTGVYYSHLLETIHSGTKPRVVAYQRDPMVLSHKLNEPRQLAPQAKDFTVKVPVESKTFGLCLNLPKAVAYMNAVYDN